MLPLQLYHIKKRRMRPHHLQMRIPALLQVWRSLERGWAHVCSVKRFSVGSIMDFISKRKRSFRERSRRCSEIFQYDWKGPIEHFLCKWGFGNYFDLSWNHLQRDFMDFTFWIHFKHIQQWAVSRNSCRNKCRRRRGIPVFVGVLGIGICIMVYYKEMGAKIPDEILYRRCWSRNCNSLHGI